MPMLALTKTSRPASSIGAPSRAGVSPPARRRPRRGTRNDHQEFVAPQARNGVGVAGHRPQPLGGAAQQLVAVGMPEALVDALEVVEIEKEHGDRTAASTRIHQRPAEPVEREEAVRQAGQLVEVGLVDQPLLVLLADGDVLLQRHEVEDRAVLGDQGRDPADFPKGSPFLRRFWSSPRHSLPAVMLAQRLW